LLKYDLKAYSQSRIRIYAATGEKQVTKEIKLFLEFEQMLILKKAKSESEIYV
jgi:hypothetical protein